MKKLIAIVLGVIIAGSLVSCGISEEVYNAVISERDAALAKIQTLQGDLSKAHEDLTTEQSRTTTLEGDLSSAESQVATLEGDFSSAESQIETLEGDISSAESQIETLEGDLSSAGSEIETLEGDLYAAEAFISSFMKPIWWIGQAHFPSGTPYFESFYRLAMNITIASGGRLVVEAYPGGSIVPAAQELDGIINGSLDIGTTVTMYWQEKFGPVTNLFTYTIDGLSPTEKQMWYLESDGLELLHEMTSDYPVYFPGGIVMPPENFLLSTVPLKTLNDIKGLKIRTAGDDGMVFARMGASVVFISGREVYEAVKRGIVDACQLSSPTVDWSFGMQEVIDYMYRDPARQPHEWNPIMINMDSWRELPDDLKLLVIEAVKAEAQSYYAEIIRADLEAIEKFKDYGVKVERAPQPIVDELVRQAEILYADYAARDRFFAEVYNSIQEFKKASREAWLRL